MEQQQKGLDSKHQSSFIRNAAGDQMGKKLFTLWLAPCVHWQVLARDTNKIVSHGLARITVT
eukprot:998899-Pelagomonas_calceolata.AAC.2